MAKESEKEKRKKAISRFLANSDRLLAENEANKKENARLLQENEDQLTAELKRLDIDRRKYDEVD